MKINKSGFAAQRGGAAEGDMEIINGYSRKKLEPEEVYTFSLILCDNDVDRDMERFSENTLKDLAELFRGKTGISDHDWKSENQVARIYRTEIERDGSRKTLQGDDYVCLRAWAYMLRTAGNEELIAQIEGGIKRETSIGCSVAQSVCSICGKPMGSPECGHSKGQSYGGKLCHAILEGAVDAYEWSFVAVPAQKNAGVTKALDLSKGLSGFVESEAGRELYPEFQRICKEAELGRRYLRQLKSEVKRLALICDRALHDSLEGSIETMDEGALEELKGFFTRRAGEKLPVFTQLPGADSAIRFDGGEYQI